MKTLQGSTLIRCLIAALFVCASNCLKCSADPTWNQLDMKPVTGKFPAENAKETVDKTSPLIQSIPPPQFESTSPKPIKVQEKISEPAKPAIKGSATRAAADVNEFGLGLFKALLASDPTRKNLVLSPFSASLAVALASTGAKGETQKEMLHALGSNYESVLDLQHDVKSLLNEMVSNKWSADVNISQGLFANKAVHLHPNFVKGAKETFDAPVRIVSTAEEINDWVKQRTHGKITEIVDQPPDSIAIVQTVYFKGQWRETFAPSATATAPFHLTDGSAKPVMMMNKLLESSSALVTNDFQAVRLPYGEWDRARDPSKSVPTAMYIFLPDKNSNITDFCSKLSGHALDGYIKRFAAMRTLELSLPRFKVENTIGLIKPLEQLGIKEAFGHAADFSAVSSDRVYISSCQQKAFLLLNENGTEAAAATEVGMSKGAFAGRPLQIKVDRPFFYCLRDDNNGVILFMGVVGEPVDGGAGS